MGYGSGYQRADVLILSDPPGGHATDQHIAASRTGAQGGSMAGHIACPGCRGQLICLRLTGLYGIGTYPFDLRCRSGFLIFCSKRLIDSNQCSLNCQSPIGLDLHGRIGFDADGLGLDTQGKGTFDGDAVLHRVDNHRVVA